MNNNVVKADAMEKPAQSNNAKGGQQGATGEANGTQGDQQQGKSTNGVGEQQNGTQTAGSTNGKTQTPANSGTGTATDEKAPQGDSTTNPVAKPILKIQQLKCNMLVQKRMLIKLLKVMII